MNVIQIDPRDDVAFDRWFEAWHVIDMERWPNRPGWQRAELLTEALDHDGPSEHRCLVASEDGMVRGVASMELSRRENLHLANADIRVLPEFRRQGIGSAILEVVQHEALAAGRSDVGGMDEVPTGHESMAAARGFARHHGFTPVMEMIRRALYLPPDPVLMARLEDAQRERSRGYSMISFTDRWPDEYLEDRCEFGRRMSTDAPVGEQVLDEEVWDVDRVRHMEASMAAQDRAKLTTAARHDASGRLVAFTEVAIPLGAPESVWQHDTLVMREHRGHGLGMAVKLANVAALVAAFPLARTVSTWNAADNEYMIAINDEMGHVVEAESTTWVKHLAQG